MTHSLRKQAEVLQFLFSREDERILKSEKCAAKMTLPRAHQWLPSGWLMEVRAGGKNMDMMFKFYVHPHRRVRLQSKDDVLRYLKNSKISKCDTNGQCDLSSYDNILAQVDLSPTGLPSGWVTELVFRKTKDGSIRRDPYYTDPTCRYIFRTLKAAISYLESGKVPKRAFIRRASIHDIYSFDKCVELVFFILALF
ncbi:hypothetical protein PR202_gb11793 [Eleusine coracana subsp. coracana]|uniref:MBD domain-containing protein n=1 Tax=Eleusine coracana subsp. coracana TaxID=191504 RepID=A0AAV5ENI0_ELECO|nr:hypothetical protein PR202_gb11793 [Eleusine coracana subsp. coracana]